MRRRLFATLFTLAILASLVLSATASAANDGRGFYGETDDKVVTDAGFILIVFFPTFVFAMSRLQAYLEKRKKARQATEKSQMGNAFLRGGW